MPKNNNPFIIAELGARYSNINRILKLIKDCKKIGADAVKFQTYRASNLADKNSKLPLKKKISQFEFFKKHQLSDSDHQKIVKVCKSLDIKWFSTPANFSDVDYLEKLQPWAYKIGSDDLTNIPLIQYIAKKKKRIFISTGMSTMKEISEAIKSIEKFHKKIVIFHCTTDYPTRLDDSNLNLIKTLRKKFNYEIGLSDHTDSDLTSIIATSMGVKFIEKHIMPNENKEWQDKEVSLDLKNFKEMVIKVKSLKKVYGSKKKKIFDCEKKWRKIGKKSLYAVKDIKKGERLNYSNVIIRRPSGQSEPKELIVFNNKKLKVNLKAGQNLKKSHFYLD